MEETADKTLQEGIWEETPVESWDQGYTLGVRKQKQACPVEGDSKEIWPFNLGLRWKKNKSHPGICNHEADPRAKHKLTTPVWSKPQAKDVFKSGSKPCEYTRNYWIIYSKRVNFMVDKLHLKYTHTLQ